MSRFLHTWLDNIYRWENIESSNYSLDSVTRDERLSTEVRLAGYTLIGINGGRFSGRTPGFARYKERSIFGPTGPVSDSSKPLYGTLTDTHGRMKAINYEQ